MDLYQRLCIKTVVKGVFNNDFGLRIVIKYLFNNDSDIIIAKD